MYLKKYIYNVYAKCARKMWLKMRFSVVLCLYISVEAAEMFQKVTLRCARSTGKKYPEMFSKYASIDVLLNVPKMRFLKPQTSRSRSRAVSYS